MTKETFDALFRSDLKRIKKEADKVQHIRKTLTKGYAFAYDGAEYERKIAEAEQRAHELYTLYGRS